MNELLRKGREKDLTEKSLHTPRVEKKKEKESRVK